MVDTGKRLVVMKTSDGTPFDFKTTGARIQVHGKRATLAGSSANLHKSVRVTFVPRVSGDLAETINVSS
jgi:hypothetical protein